MTIASSGDPAAKIEYVHFRPVRYEIEALTEPINEQPNQGGLIFAYVRNASDKALRLGSWTANNVGASTYRLKGDIAWDRIVQEEVEPGMVSVVEISAVSDAFQEGKPFKLICSSGDWPPLCGTETTLHEDPISVTFIRVFPDMQHVEVFLQNRGDKAAEVLSIEIPGLKPKDIQWAGKTIEPESLTMARLALDEPIPLATLLVPCVTIQDGDEARTICGHRNAFPDRFPIGTWGIDPENYVLTRRHHIDTGMKGGSKTDDFFTRDAALYGFHAMVHTGLFPNVDMIRDLADHPAVSCWYVQDEPDWSKTPQMVFAAVQMTHEYNRTKPTLITLCRNVQFFKYAFIPDIATHDHYCVTAPTTSKWPHRYGTRLEETAYYTRDLRYAAYPKPTWVWTQGIFDWGERPKRPVPTPDEAAAQLLLNVGRGTKGILWFTFKKKTGDKFPDLRAAIQGWNRVLVLTRESLLSSEPVALHAQSPETVDVAPLCSWDRLFLLVTNLDYKIDDQAYQWTQAKDVSISVDLPAWINPQVCVDLKPEGPQALPLKCKRGKANLKLDSLDAVRFLVLDNDPDAFDRYAKSYRDVLTAESE